MPRNGTSVVLTGKTASGICTASCNSSLSHASGSVGQPTQWASDGTHRVLPGFQQALKVGSSCTWNGKGKADVVEAAAGGAAEACCVVAALLILRPAILTHTSSTAQQARVFVPAYDAVAAGLTNSSTVCRHAHHQYVYVTIERVLCLNIVPDDFKSVWTI